MNAPKTDTPRNESAMDANLTLQKAHEFLDLNGVHWKFATLKAYVFFGRIPSVKMFNSRVIPREALLGIINEHKLKKAGLK